MDVILIIVVAGASTGLVLALAGWRATSVEPAAGRGRLGDYGRRAGLGT